MSIDEIKQCALSILLYLDDFCKKRNITYWLCGGTLIGAVRHKGFIPWDDDIDIMMPREDYDKLCSEFSNSGRYKLMTSDNVDNFPYSYCKLVDSETTKLEPIRRKFQKIGVDIDIFPIDNYPAEIEDAARMCDAIKKEQRKLHFILAKYGRGRNLLKTIARFFATCFWHLTDNIGINTSKKYILRIQSLSQQFNSSETGYRGISIIAHYGVRERNKKSVYASTVEVEFEGYLLPAPVGYHDYLTNLYGDYMQLPPLDKRETHHDFKAFKK